MNQNWTCCVTLLRPCLESTTGLYKNLLLTLWGTINQLRQGPELEKCPSNLLYVCATQDEWWTATRRVYYYMWQNRSLWTSVIRHPDVNIINIIINNSNLCVVISAPRLIPIHTRTRLTAQLTWWRLIVVSGYVCTSLSSGWTQPARGVLIGCTYLTASRASRCAGGARAVS